MDRPSIEHQVRRLFEGSAARGTKVAVEQEHFAFDLAGGGPVAPARVRAAVEGRPYAHLVSFEPGGQVELSMPTAADAATLREALVLTTRQLSADLAPHGIVLVTAPVSQTDAPRYLHSPRYDAMERHFDAIGPAGRRMMRSTASTQVCLDWWSGRAGIEQWRVLLLAGPFLAAAVCSSTRLATWLEVDPGRTAFDDRLLRGDCPVAAYADFAASATTFVDGVEEHVSTLFPPVRPRPGYLEVRFPDARRAVEVEPVVAGLAALLYDDGRRRAALDSLRGEQPRLGDLWAAAAAGQLDPSRGRALLGGRIPEAVAA